MSKIQWVKWKKHQGVKYMGSCKYNPPQPWGPWTKILGVVARCEGNHDTVVSYDNTGLTFGAFQWTFTSGRLQKLIQYMKSVPYYDVMREDLSEYKTLFDEIFFVDKTGLLDDGQIFEDFDFQILGGRFVDLLPNQYFFLDPSKPKEKDRIRDICMGRLQHKKFKDQKEHAINLANVFIKAGENHYVQMAQIDFAKMEFKQHLDYKRKPLGDVRTIRNLLGDTWEIPLPALFFSLWQNSPGAAYKLFLRAKRNSGDDPEKYFELAWRYVNRSTFGNWGWSKGNKSPRVVRIKKAIKEFYGIDLKYYK